MPIDPKALDMMVEAGAKAEWDFNTARYPDGSSYMEDKWEGAPEPLRKLYLGVSRRTILAALHAAEALDVPHKLVGRDATEGMISARGNVVTTWEDTWAGNTREQVSRNFATLDWRAMFDAAPRVGDDNL